MFERDIENVNRAMHPLSNGKLHCLPSSRALLDYFDARGIDAQPLVARAVVFASVTGSTWKDLLQTIPPTELFQEAVESPYPNGTQKYIVSSEELRGPCKVQIKYRTLGYTHQMSEMGSYAENGSWRGHLVVVAKNTVIDMTLGQLNSDEFGIDFKPPYITVGADDGFLSGQDLLVGLLGSMMVCYKAFPTETTFEQSGSWSDPHFREQLREVGTRAARSTTSQHKIKGKRLTKKNRRNRKPQK